MKDATPTPRISRFRLTSALALARLVLLWERLWPRLWPAAAVAGGFLALALFDVFRYLPMWLHIAVLAAVVAALVVLLVRAGRGLAPVSDEEARHRVEIASGLAHRPLATLEDRLSTHTPSRAERRLWEVHRARVVAQIGRLRVGWPKPGMAARDPYAVRSALVMVLFVAVVAGAGDVGPRLTRALVPEPHATAASHDLVADIWITPPAYTGQAPVLLKGVDFSRPAGEERRPLLMPVGSTVLAQLSGPSEKPVLKLGKRTVPLENLGGKGADKGARLEAEIGDADVGAKQMVLDAGNGHSAVWPVDVPADQPPHVEFTRAPSRTGPGHLQIAYLAHDDYGLASLSGVIRRPDGSAAPNGDTEIRFSLPLTRSAGRVEGSVIKDYTAHPWAGLPIEIHLEATDDRGQIGRTETIRMVLPARVFQQPVARALIKLRRRLVENPSPATRADVAAALDDITANPHRFFDDAVAFLAMRVVRGRLTYDLSKQAVVQSIDLLWKTALRIEDGEYAIAEQELMRRQEDAMQALNDGATGKELNRVMQQLHEAMQKFFDALSKKLGREGLSELPFMPQNRMMSSGDLQRMLERARQLAQAGDLAAAKQQLAQLEKMLEQLRNGSLHAPPKGALAKARKMMNNLRDLARRQQQMLNRTFREAQREAEAGQQQGQQPQGPRSQGQQQGAMPGPQGGGQQQMPGGGQMGQGQMGQGQTGQGRMGQGQQGQGQMGQGQAGGAGTPVPTPAEQEALRRRLGDLMLQMDSMLGSIPPALGEAERAMHGAVGALRQNSPGDAVPFQSTAVDKLRQATEQAAEKLAQRMSGMMGLAPRGGRAQGRGRDPFGRNDQGTGGMNAATSGVKVPDKAQMQRAHDILNELRRRAGQRNRPSYELEYIDRLLERF